MDTNRHRPWCPTNTLKLENNTKMPTLQAPNSKIAVIIEGGCNNRDHSHQYFEF